VQSSIHYEKSDFTYKFDEHFKHIADDSLLFFKSLHLEQLAISLEQFLHVKLFASVSSLNSFFFFRKKNYYL